MKMTVPFFSVAGTYQRLQLTPSFRHAVVLCPVKPPTYITMKRKGKSRYYDRAVNIKFKVFGRVHTCYNGSRDCLRKQWTQITIQQKQWTLTLKTIEVHPTLMQWNVNRCVLSPVFVYIDAPNIIPWGRGHSHQSFLRVGFGPNKSISRVSDFVCT